MTTSEVLPVETAAHVVDDWLTTFRAALDGKTYGAAAELFLVDGYWRDLLALTWDLRTFQGRTRIAEGLATALSSRDLRTLALEDKPPEVFERARRGWSIEAFLELETDIGRGRGHLRLLQDPDTGEWRAWTLLTSLEELKGFEERVGKRRPKGHSPHLAAATCDAEDAAADPLQDLDVLVLGAAQSGLSVAARLKQMGASHLVVERLDRVGDSWRNRYQSLLLHNEVWANHLPYLPFPSTYPVYIDKDELADWLEAYATIMGLTVWTGTTLVDVSFDEAGGWWSFGLRLSDGTVARGRARHLVLATGVFGAEKDLDIPGSEDFGGRVLKASEYDGDVAVQGTRALVIGTGSSAHDVAQDLCSRGAEVTMLQRSSTTVVSVEPGAARAYAIYNEDGIPVEDADLISNAFPLPLLADLHKDLTKRIAELDADLLDGLRAAGFQLDFGEDESGFLMKYHRYGGGYYINVGCSELIVAGDVAVRHGVEVERLTADGVVFTDGTTMDVDMVVVAIGYQNMSEVVRRILGDEVADRVGPVWGLDEEGEVRNMWRRTGQPHLWIMGGSLQQVRPYSRYLALQIKGELEGLLPASSAHGAP